MIVPTGVWIASEKHSTSECDAWMNSILKLPISMMIVRLDAMQQHVVRACRIRSSRFSVKGERKSRRINRQIEFAENIGESADVVFVAVREDDRGQIVAIFFEKIEIWNRDIDAKRRFLRKAHPGIDDYHLVAVPDSHAVHPKFADPAERDYFDLAHKT